MIRVESSLSTVPESASIQAQFIECELNIEYRIQSRLIVYSKYILTITEIEVAVSSHKSFNEYRANVAIVICNDQAQVLWARRIGHDGWQFPQGGIDDDESTIDAVYREMEEELGLKPTHVRLIGSTKDWLKYDIPEKYVRIRSKRKLKGQMQKWFMFKFIGDESDFCLDCSTHPEFDDWKWVNYWTPAHRVISFKRDVYRKALAELEPYVHQIHNGG